MALVYCPESLSGSAGEGTSPSKEGVVKKLLCAVAVVGLMFSGAVAQESMGKIGVFAGFGQSAFEDQDDAAGYIPAGVQGLYQVTPGLFVGAEVNIAVVKFTWELESGGEKIAEWSVSQTIFGALAKYEFGQGRIKPLLRAGFGMYTGGSDVEPEPGYTGGGETDYKSAFGFNVGGGATGALGEKMYWVGEFVYHIVSREADVEGAESFGANNWAIQAGVGMGF
jgi:hypothetical protein